MAKKKRITKKSTKKKSPKKTAVKKTAVKKRAAKKTAAKKTAARKKSEPMTTVADRGKSFQADDYILVVHDNDPKYAGSGGCVISADGLVHVTLSHAGKRVRRSYVPSQIMKLE